MNQEALELLSSGTLVTTGVVTSVTGSSVAVRSPELGERSARVAVMSDWRAQRGDQVLLLSDGRGQTYVVGVLRALREADAAPELSGLALSGLALSGLAVERRDGVTHLSVADGDLMLSAPKGRVKLAADEGVELESEADLSLRARRAVHIESHDGERARSSLRLDGDAAKLEAGVIAARAARLAVLAEDVTALASRLDARIDDVRQRAERIETRATEIIEHAKESYREVEGLAQTRAGRLRWVAETSLSALADRAKLKAKSIFAIDGESIHLG